MSVKINTLEIENVKRIKALRLEPAENGLTIIGGNNAQGKTSVLDSICWALGGDKYKPSNPVRDGSFAPPSLKVTLNNGLTVERKGKNCSLKVTDPEGRRAGQQLLNEFISSFALDLPKFMDASDKDKAEILLQIIGVGDKLHELEDAEKKLYNKRTAIGQIAEQKKKYAEELHYWDGIGDTPVSASELIAQQQAILLHNAENHKKRLKRDECEKALEAARIALDEAQRNWAQAQSDFMTASKSAEDLQDESTAELEQNIAEIDAINAKIRDNQNKVKAQQEALDYNQQYDALTDEIESLRSEKKNLLNSANLPLPELAVEGGRLLYKGKAWDCMSSSEQLRVSTAIVRCLNPNCGFVLLDKLEQMDIHTLAEFGKWLESEGLQAIATRVSDGDECSIIIADGEAIAPVSKTIEPKKSWTAGAF